MYENTDLGRAQKGRFLNTSTDNKQCIQDSLEDYLEPRKKTCKQGY